MSTWTTSAQARPELAELGRQLLDEQNGYAYLATVTADGAPRVHPVVPVLVDGDLRQQCVERQDLNQVTIADDQVVFELRVDRFDA
jgi:hypothetical protein